MGVRLKRFIWTLGIIALISGAYGVFIVLDSSILLHLRLAESLYSSIQFFTISHPDYLVFAAEGDQVLYQMNWPMQVARFLAPLVTVTAAISLFSFAIENWYKRLRVRLFYRKHAVVFGFNLRSRMLCEDLVQRKIPLVLADPNLTLEDLEWLRKRGIIAFRLSDVDGSSPEICGVEKAKYLFAMHDQDSQNLKTLVRVYQRNKEVFGTSELADNAKKTDAISTRCFVHFSELNFRHLKFGSQFTDLDDYFNLQIFSVYEHSARRLTRKIYLKFANEILLGKRLRIVLFGTGKTGQALLEQLVRMSFFQRNDSAFVTVIDDNANGWNDLVARFPVFSLDRNFYDAENASRIEVLKQQIGFPEIEFRKMTFDSASLLTGRSLENGPEDQEVITIAILASADATRNLTIADALLQQKNVEISEIFVRSDESDSEIRNYIRSELIRKHLSGFPTLDEICKLSTLDEGPAEILARTIHEEYLKEMGNPTEIHPSLAPWAKLDEIFKESNRRAASHIEIKCGLLGISDLNIGDSDSVKKATSKIRSRLSNKTNVDYLETLAECEHSRWCIEKLLDGWVPGPSRNDKRKEHPNLVPWKIAGPKLESAFSGFTPLDETDKQKDRNNIEKIPALLDELVSESTSETHSG